jgi:hypothetical protein
MNNELAAMVIPFSEHIGGCVSLMAHEPVWFRSWNTNHVALRFEGLRLCRSVTSRYCQRLRWSSILMVISNVSLKIVFASILPWAKVAYKGSCF